MKFKYNYSFEARSLSHSHVHMLRQPTAGKNKAQIIENIFFKGRAPQKK